MCTNPQFIKDSRFRGMLHRNTIVVPCGDCYECKYSRAQSLYVRARKEYEYAIAHGGIGFMCCLTYSNDIVPKYDFGHGEVFVFNKKHVILFIKRLRMNIERKYRKYTIGETPTFKYLVTSEFGTDPTKTHRPHYHLIIIFDKYINPFTFRASFIESLYDRRHNNKRYFGVVQQCEPIDPKRGGIQYSAKYICKDVSYANQNENIHELIAFEKHKINMEFGICENPRYEEDFLKNSCIRSTKAYKKAVEERLRPLRHMLQFVMTSNDFGGNVIFNEYKEKLIDTPVITFDKFPYKVPQIVKDRIERHYGKQALEMMSTNAFRRYVSNYLKDLVNEGCIDSSEAFDLNLFVKNYVITRHNQIEFIIPDVKVSTNVQQLLPDVEYLRPWSELINETQFYDDNDFYVIRNRLVRLLNLSYLPSAIASRLSLSEHKRQVRENIEQSKYHRI